MPQQNSVFKVVKDNVSILSMLADHGIEPNHEGKILCLFHDEKTPSLQIYPETNTFKCYGCGKNGDVIDLYAGVKGSPESDTFRAAKELAKKYNLPYDTSHSKKPSQSKGKAKVNLMALAEKTGLPTGYLKDQGLFERGGVVIIPYFLMDGSRALRYRIRKSLTNDDGPKLIWDKEQKGKGNILPYGLNKIIKFKYAKDESPYVIIVEGESDCWTLWFHRLPAIGIPGASMSKVLKLEHVASFKRIYIWQEPDHAGEEFPHNVAKHLTKIGYEGEVYVINGRQL